MTMTGPAKVVIGVCECGADIREGESHAVRAEGSRPVYGRIGNPPGSGTDGRYQGHTLGRVVWVCDRCLRAGQ